jgi:Gram-negative bacterial TonB protein C-terminal
MFSPWSNATTRRQRRFLAASVLLHGVLLGWLLHASEPELLQPSAIAFGQNGNSVTRLYWTSQNFDDSTHSSSDQATERYRHQRLGPKPTFKKPAQLAKLPAPRSPLVPAEATDNSRTQTLSALGHGAEAGQAYGTLNRGPMLGDEVRPALPVATADPVVYPWQLPDSPGNEVIEITIDERGEIINKTVLVSLGANIDQKCLAALENWHFHPATKNGSPIASKQDAIFPFRARG